MSRAAVARWVALALAGLLVAIGVAIAATNLASQQIGIASESVSAGDSLAPSFPRHRAEAKPRRERHDGEPTTPTTPFEQLPPPAEEAVPPPAEEAETQPGGSDDSGHDGGGGGGGGASGGGDD